MQYDRRRWLPAGGSITCLDCGSLFGNIASWHPNRHHPRPSGRRRLSFVCIEIQRDLVELETIPAPKVAVYVTPRRPGRGRQRRLINCPPVEVANLWQPLHDAARFGLGCTEEGDPKTSTITLQPLVGSFATFLVGKTYQLRERLDAAVADSNAGEDRSSSSTFWNSCCIYTGSK